MAKIVLDVILMPNHSKNNILVYDEAKDCFVEMHKETFLKQEYAKINELEQKIDNLNKKIVENNGKISRMATILKESVK